MQAEVRRMEGLRLTLPQMIADLTEALSVAPEGGTNTSAVRLKDLMMAEHQGPD